MIKQVKTERDIISSIMLSYNIPFIFDRTDLERYISAGCTTVISRDQHNDTSRTKLGNHLILKNN